MKKIIAWTLVILSLVSLLACTDSEQSAIVTPEPEVTQQPVPEETEPVEEEEIVIVDPSEWKTAESPALTAETLAIFEKGFAGLLGVRYVPLAYLGKQVVSGTVHTFLTRYGHLSRRKGNICARVPV